jgi:ribosome maturation protein Sdo1
MAQIVARIRKGSNHYEILVDEAEALKVKKEMRMQISMLLF